MECEVQEVSSPALQSFSRSCTSTLGELLLRCLVPHSIAPGEFLSGGLFVQAPFLFSFTRPPRRALLRKAQLWHDSGRSEKIWFQWDLLFCALVCRCMFCDLVGSTLFCTCMVCSSCHMVGVAFSMFCMFLHLFCREFSS